MTSSSFLLVVSRGDRTQNFAFHQDVVTIGRSREADVVLQDRRVSRHHAELRRTDDGFEVTNSGGQNPIKLRGRPVDSAEIRFGDAFHIGGYELRLAEPPREHISLDETRIGEPPRSDQDLTTFLEIAKALNDEHDLSRLLTRILDAAIQLSGSERGFIILGRSDDSTVEVARNFAQEEVLSPEYKISRTIAKRVMDSGVAERTTNAQEDARFRDLASVTDLRLRSVLCIPIRIRGQVGGVMYVDNRLQQHVFQEREKELLVSLADQAGVAIHTARSMEVLKRQSLDLEAAVNRVDQLNAALKGQLAERTQELDRIKEEFTTSTSSRGSRHAYRKITGDGRAIRKMLSLLDKFIDSEDPVLVLGESGVGKELVARAIHEHGRRSGKAFISENCAALPESLLESELFGYAKGAFTGATTNKKGLLELADGGVLFLDEVGDMALDLQKKLLRVLQEGEVRPLGSSKTLPVDVRLITATNRNLEEMVREGEFREDLFYRLNVLPLRVPPLRERMEDVPALVSRFLEELAAEEGGKRVRISADALDALSRHRWPGNVRELQNEIRRAAVMCDGVILESHLSSRVRAPDEVFDSGTLDGPTPVERGTDLPALVAELESREIRRAMHKSGDNKSRAAEMLGVSRFALQRKLEKYEIGMGDGAAGGADKETITDADSVEADPTDS